jgi:protein-S-isoprenylcysteine O-methyltransferase Ste14
VASGHRYVSERATPSSPSLAPDASGTSAPAWAVQMTDGLSGPPADVLLDVVPRVALASYLGYAAIVKAIAIGRLLRVPGFAVWSATSVITLVPTVATMLFALVMATFVVVRRRRVANLPGLYPKVVALAGGFLSTAVGWLPYRAHASLRLDMIASILVLVGSALAAIVLVWLGRSFSIMPEARRLVVTGPYRLVRHPLYVCEAFLLLGIFIQYSPPWCYIVVVAQVALQLERMRLEEGVLKTAFPEYESYAAHTARIIPGVY